MSDRDQQDISVVGSGAKVEGTFVSTGSLRIAGKVKGAITVEELKSAEPVDILPRILTLPEVSRMRGA